MALIKFIKAHCISPLKPKETIYRCLLRTSYSGACSCLYIHTIRGPYPKRLLYSECYTPVYTQTVPYNHIHDRTKTPTDISRI